LSTEDYSPQQVAIQAAGAKLFKGLTFIFNPPSPSTGFADRTLSIDRQEAERYFSEGLAELVHAITQRGDGATP